MKNKWKCQVFEEPPLLYPGIKTSKQNEKSYFYYIITKELLKRTTEEVIMKRLYSNGKPTSGL